MAEYAYPYSVSADFSNGVAPAKLSLEVGEDPGIAPVLLRVEARGRATSAAQPGPPAARSRPR